MNKFSRLSVFHCIGHCVFVDRDRCIRNRKWRAPTNVSGDDRVAKLRQRVDGRK